MNSPYDTWKTASPERDFPSGRATIFLDPFELDVDCDNGRCTVLRCSLQVKRAEWINITGEESLAIVERALQPEIKAEMAVILEKRPC